MSSGVLNKIRYGTWTVATVCVTQLIWRDEKNRNRGSDGWGIWRHVSFYIHKFYWSISLRNFFRTSLVVKHRPTMQETRVQSLGRKDLLEKEMGTHSSILSWEIPWSEDPDGLQSIGSQRVGPDWATDTHIICCSSINMVVFQFTNRRPHTFLYHLTWTSTISLLNRQGLLLFHSLEAESLRGWVAWS